MENRKNKSSIAIITHEYVIKFLLAGLFNLDKNSAYKIPIGNASLTCVSYDNGTWKERVRNDTSHLAVLGVPSKKSRYEKG